MTPPLIGVTNAGSSSLKFSVFDGERAVLIVQVDGIGARPSIKATGPDNEFVPPPGLDPNPPKAPSDALPAIMAWAAKRLGDRPIGALGHRVVHGGARFTQPARVTAELLAELETLTPLAPIHEPSSLAPMRTAMRLHPNLAAGGVFRHGLPPRGA